MFGRFAIFAAGIIVGFAARDRIDSTVNAVVSKLFPRLSASATEEEETAAAELVGPRRWGSWCR